MENWRPKEDRLVTGNERRIVGSRIRNDIGGIRREVYLEMIDVMMENTDKAEAETKIGGICAKQ